MTIYCDGKKVKQSRERETDLSYKDYESCKQIECFVSDSYLDGRN
jgi:hypothetical protein